MHKVSRRVFPIGDRWSSGEYESKYEDLQFELPRQGSTISSAVRRAGKSSASSPGTAKSLSSSVTLHPTDRVNSRRYSALLFAFGLLLAGCGEPERPSTTTNVTAAPVGASFDQIGKVSLYPGESCASQIMFVFHSGRSRSISMAAPFRVSRILTDAAHDHKTVHVWGKWRRGNTAGCSYVEATQVESQKSFW